MKGTYYIVLPLILILISSCAKLPSKKIPTSYRDDSINGLVVGTISILNERPYFNAYNVIYREIGSKTSSSIVIAPEQIVKFKLVPDFFDGNKAVYLFSFEKPAGNYEFFNLGFFVNSGSVFYQGTKFSSDFSLPFQVKSGEITYIGEIVIDSRNRSSYQEVNDKYDRDIAGLSEKSPGIEWKLAQNETIMDNFE